MEYALPSVLTLRVAAGFAAIAALAIVVQLAALQRSPPVRCADGFNPQAGRCCAEGQVLAAGHCEGRARGCGPEHEYVEIEGEIPGCVLIDEPISIGGGVLPPGAVDFQVSERARKVEVAPFRIDRGEVTLRRYSECERAFACEKISRGPRELGLPVTGVAPAAAERFCRFAGGRLPSSAEWRLAAAGAEARRFPWGFTGLVCRRAAFGLVSGPCSTAGTGPDLVGARLAGATPDGILDLSGNVAEWTRDPDGRYRARGGSFRSRVAVELVTAAVEVAAEDAPWVGFRCVYSE